MKPASAVFVISKAYPEYETQVVAVCSSRQKAKDFLREHAREETGGYSGCSFMVEGPFQLDARESNDDPEYFFSGGLTHSRMKAHSNV